VLSRRGAALAEAPPLAPYIGAHFERAADAWTPDHPDGYVSLCIAENTLMWDVLAPRFAAVDDAPERVFGYDAMIGALPFREQLAEFMGRTFLGRSVAPAQLAAVAGAGSVLELLFTAIGDPGDAVLVPTPSYSGFWPDIQTRAALEVVPVHTHSDDAFRLTTDALDAALAASARPVKALLFTNPDNPLGRVATPEQVREIAAWGERHGIHVVFDEIYALSVFGPQPFTSVAALRERLGPLIHVVWAFSKDIGASGLRCGVLFSENAALLRAVDAFAYWAACSGDTQHRLGRLVADTQWIDAFIVENRARLSTVYAQVRDALVEIGVPMVPAEAGIFVVCDLRRWLDEPTVACERALWARILDEANVNLTPGEACRISERGFFRLCYAAAPTPAVLEGIRRIGRVLGPGD
jgi:aspartate/methionine/tyrosine aminotransferase